MKKLSIVACIALATVAFVWTAVAEIPVSSEPSDVAAVGGGDIEVLILMGVDVPDWMLQDVLRPTNRHGSCSGFNPSCRYKYDGECCCIAQSPGPGCNPICF